MELSDQKLVEVSQLLCALIFDVNGLQLPDVVALATSFTLQTVQMPDVLLPSVCQPQNSLADCVFPCVISDGLFRSSVASAVGGACGVPTAEAR